MENKPHWSPEADYGSFPFFIRRMDTVGYFKPAEAPVAQLPASIPAPVNTFPKSVFNPDQIPGTIAYYAALANISENYLSRLVKQSTGRSVGAWIDIVRIQRAKRLLSSTPLSIIDIAASVGVEDQSYFSRLFKKETGLTPSAFRKKMQG